MRKIWKDFVAFIMTGNVLMLFLIVKSYEAYQARKVAAGEEPPEEPSEEVILLRRIADAVAPPG